jgi:hypothetical protein
MHASKIQILCVNERISVSITFKYKQEITRGRIFSNNTLKLGGPGSSVGIATDYGLDGSGIEFRWG